MDTSAINNAANQVSQTAYESSAAASSKTAPSDKTGKVSGKTIGKPQLSENAAKYYEQLKKKYSNMDFILVSRDQKETAQAQAGQYANANKLVVLIDEDKIERMASDESYRKKYEGIISGATTQLASIQSGLGQNASAVKGYGMSVGDGGNASFFAVIDKSLAAQKERIAEKAKDKKAQAREDAKKQAQERLEGKKNEQTKKTDGTDSKSGAGQEDEITITASSPEELLQKIQDMMYAIRSDNIFTEQEKGLGSNIDFSA